MGNAVIVVIIFTIILIHQVACSTLRGAKILKHTSWLFLFLSTLTKSTKIVLKICSFPQSIENNQLPTLHLIFAWELKVDFLHITKGLLLIFFFLQPIILINSIGLWCDLHWIFKYKNFLWSLSVKSNSLSYSNRRQYFSVKYQGILQVILKNLLTHIPGWKNFLVALITKRSILKFLRSYFKWI